MKYQVEVLVNGEYPEYGSRLPQKWVPHPTEGTPRATEEEAFNASLGICGRTRIVEVRA